MKTLIVALILTALTLVTLIITPFLSSSAPSPTDVVVGRKVIIPP